MSDRAPKVTVQPAGNGKWFAFCREQGCNWTHTPHPKTYVEERARVHRAEHRKAVDRG